MASTLTEKVQETTFHLPRVYIEMSKEYATVTPIALKCVRNKLFQIIMPFINFILFISLHLFFLLSKVQTNLVAFRL